MIIICTHKLRRQQSNYSELELQEKDNIFKYSANNLHIFYSL